MVDRQTDSQIDRHMAHDYAICQKVIKAIYQNFLLTKQQCYAYGVANNCRKKVRYYVIKKRREVDFVRQISNWNQIRKEFDK